MKNQTAQNSHKNLKFHSPAQPVAGAAEVHPHQQPEAPAAPPPKPAAWRLAPDSWAAAHQKAPATTPPPWQDRRLPWRLRRAASSTATYDRRSTPSDPRLQPHSPPSPSPPKISPTPPRNLNQNHPLSEPWIQTINQPILKKTTREKSSFSDTRISPEEAQLIRSKWGSLQRLLASDHGQSRILTVLFS